jgi:hypothetical protein
MEYAPTHHHVSNSTGSCLLVEVSSEAVTCPVATGPAFQPRWAPTCRRVSSSTGSFLPTEVGSRAATCLVALDPSSQPRWASTLPRVPWLWTCVEGSRSCLSAGRAPSCHASHGPLWAAGYKHKKRHSRPAHAARSHMFLRRVTSGSS